MQKPNKEKATNKKFLRNTGAAILSLVLVIALVIGLIPGNVVQAAVVSDADTSTKYSESLGDNASTEYSGRIWTDKSVYTEDTTFLMYGGGSTTVENDSDFLVAYSALATGMEVKGHTSSPLDVVFVIDMSGSMSTSMDNRQNRLYNATVALNNAMKKLLALNDYVRIGVVAFNSTSNILLPLDHYEQINGAEFFTCSGTTITINARGINNTYTRKRVSSSSGTNIQKGVFEGMNMLASEDSTYAVINGAQVQRIPSVVILSDGQPSNASNYSAWWDISSDTNRMTPNGTRAVYGMKALMTAAYMKAAIDRNYGGSGPTAATVYSIGVGIDDLSSDDRALAYATINPNDTTLRNSTNRLVEDIQDTWESYTNGFNPQLGGFTFRHPSQYDIVPEDKDIDALYYVDAYSDADEADTLTEVFDGIVSSISVKAAEVPTEIKGSDPMTDGYITYTDPIGKYMEVKDVKSILYAGQEFTQKTKTTSADGLTTTYTFTGTVDSAIYGQQNINNILITVTKDAAGDETITIKIPASVIPVRVNSVELNADGTVKSHTNNGAYPARVLYTVGLKEGLTTTVDGATIIDTEEIDDAYEAANTNEDGTINFYSNLYTGTNVVNGMTAGDTTVEFEPAHTNPFYYIQEDMPIYTKDTQGNLQKVSSSAALDPKATYYIDDIYYHGTTAVNGTVERTGEQLLKTDLVSVGGYWYRASGSPRLNRILRFEGTKADASITNTAQDFYAPTFEYAEGNSDPYAGKFVVYLGNNGVLSHPATGALEITKEVVMNDGLTPAVTNFEFVVDFNGNETVAGTFPYTVTKPDGGVRTGEITDGGTITLADGESVKISKLAPGTTYTVTEKAAAGYSTESSGDKGKIAAGTTSEAVFTNTYTVTSVNFPAEGGLGGTKVLTGRDWEEGTDTYTFFITPYNNAPLPVDYDAAKGVTVTKAEKTDGDWEAGFNFGQIEFTQPGVYRYTIVEKEPENDAYLPGMSYSRALYRVVVTVTDNGNGTLSASADIQKLYTDDAAQLFTYDNDNNIVMNSGQEGQDEIVFTNTYSAGPVTRTPVATKTYTDSTGAKPLVSGMFTFKFEAVGIVENNTVVAETAGEVPMPAGTTGTSITTTNEGQNVTFPSIEFKQEHLGNASTITFRYKMTEVKGDVNGMTYDENEYFIDVTLSKEATSDTLIVNSVYPNEERIINFKNEYTPDPAKAEIKGIKTLNGRNMLDGEEFEFVINGANAATSQAVMNGVIIPPQVEDHTITTVSGGSDGEAVGFTFGEFTFTKPGVYTFNITETAGNAGGVTYDSHTSAVTITVTDKDGVLMADVVYGDGKQAAFVNEYKATFTGEPVSLSGTKTLTGKTLLAGEFYFVVEDVKAGTSSVVTHTEDTTGKDGVYTGSIEFLKDVTYTEAGTYEYIISEQIPEPKVTGTTYDESKYKYTVVVEDDGKGNLKAVSTELTLYDAQQNKWILTNGVVFENTYVPEKLVIPVSSMKKVLSGNRSETLQTDEFTFTLSVVSADPEDGITLPSDTTVTNDADGYIDFGNITFTKAGTYTVKVTEVIPENAVKNEDGTYTLNGVTYTAKEIKATYEVKDTRTGTLKASIVSSSGGSTFVNTYESDGKFTLTMNKEFTGRENNEWLAADKFQFEVVILDSATQTAVDNGDLVFPSGDDGIMTLEATKDNRSVTSPEIKVYKEGTYKFIVREVTGTIAGVHYDSNPREVTVTAEDQNNGTIDVSYSVSDPNNYGLTFKNVYDPNSAELPGHDDLVITKVFDGRGETWLDTDAFIFTLAPADDVTAAAVANKDVELSSTSLTITNANKAHAHFGNIIFHKGGTYTFTVTEQLSTIAGVTNDPVPGRTIKVRVNDDGEGELVAHLATGSDSLVFTNKYSVQPATTTLPVVKKVLDGRDWTADDSFTFKLEATGDTVAAVEAGAVVLPGNTEITITGASADKTAAFGNITFTAAGTYTFVIGEEAGDDVNMTYDSTTTRITVVVTDKDEYGVPTGQLTAAASYSPDDDITFTNTYTPNPVTVDLKGKKVLEGRTLTAGEFSFRLTPVTERAPMPASNLVGNAADGMIDFGTITFTKAGTYNYQISEIHGHQEGMTYDIVPVDVTITVSYDSANGKFNVPTVTYTKGGESLQTAEFTNIYKGTPVDLIGSANLKVTKNFTGRTNNRWLASDQFTFELVSFDDATAAAITAGNIIMPADTTLVVTNTNKDNAFFGNITFKEPGTYKFAIKELPGNIAGVTNDPDSERIVTVVVEDTKTGKLEIITVDYNGEDLVFSNTYSASGVLPVEVTKEFTGREDDAWLETDEFAFELLVLDPATQAAIDAGNVILPSDANEIKITASDADRKASFAGGITFKAEGTYKFIVREKTGTISGVVYDADPRELVVVVTDANNDGKYTITSTITGGKTLTFKNEYETGHVELSGHAYLTVDKTFVGRDNDVWASGDEFTFTLTAGNDETADAITAGEIIMPDNAKGLVVSSANRAHAHFGNIIFHKTGDFTFVVTEAEGNIPGVVYDTAPRTIVVNVIDNQDGTLSAVLSNTSAPLEFENKYHDANVAITKTQMLANGSTGNPLTVSANDEITYTVKVENIGQGLASNVVVTDVIPDGLTLVQDSISDGGTLGEDGKTITWNLSTLAYGVSKTVSFRVTVPDVSIDDVNSDGFKVWKNVAVVKYTNPDDTPEETPSDEVEIKEGVPNVVIEKKQSVLLDDGETFSDSTDGVLRVDAGDIVKYTITAKNTGTENIDVFTLSDKIPEGLQLVEGSITDYFGEVTNSVITWKYLDLGPNEPIEVSFQVKVPDTEDAFTEWTNIATSNSDDPDDPDESNPVTIVNSVDAMMTGGKVMEGDRNTLTEGEFTFVLEAVTEGAPMPTVTEVTNSTGGTINFGPIEYSSAGTYVYKITEEYAGQMINGVTYDDTVYYAVVTVEKVETATLDADGNVASTAVSYKVKSITYHKDSLDSPAEETGAFTFRNSYYDANVVIAKTQSVNGGEPTGDMLTVRENDVVTYYLTVTNAGKGTASNVVVTDTLPEGLTPKAGTISDGGVYDETNRVITWNLDPLASEETKTVSFQVTVPDVKEGELGDTGYKVWKNSASVDYNNPDGDDPEDPKDEVEIKEGAPKVSAQKSQSINGEAATIAKTEVKKGDVVTYYITVTNSGTEAADDIVITDKIPEGLQLVEGSISNHGTEQDGTITWLIDQIPAEDGSVTVSFQVTVPGVTEDTVWKNIASYVYGNDPDEPDNPTDPVEIEEGVPNVEVQKLQAINGGDPTMDKLTAREGDEITYFITVKNTGTGIADDIVVTDVIPEGLTLKSGSITGDGVLGEDDKTITWNLSDMSGVDPDADPAEEPEEITVGFTVIVPDVTEDTTWKNVAVVDYKNDPDDEEDPSNPVEVTEGAPKLSFEKTQAVNGGKASAGAMNVKAGDVVTYTITVKNTGTEVAEAVKITDVIPGGLKLVAGSVTNGGTEANGIITWAVDQVAAGGSFEVSFQVTVPEVEETTKWTNIASVDYGNDPEDPDDEEKAPSNPVEITEIPEEKPGLNTGDSSNILGYMGAAMLALGAVFVQLRLRRNK